MCYERYFSIIDFKWKSRYLLPRVVTAEKKLKDFSVQNPKNNFLCEQMLLKVKKQLNHRCVFPAKQKMKLTYISFIGAENFHFMETTSGVF